MVAPAEGEVGPAVEEEDGGGWLGEGGRVGVGEEVVVGYLLGGGGDGGVVVGDPGVVGGEGVGGHDA